MTKTCNSPIRNLACEAKKRLKQGKEECYLRGTVSSITEKKMLTAEEEKLVCKVRELVEREDIILNPIGQLIDGDYYNTLSPSDKQTYIFKLSTMYIKIKRCIEDGRCEVASNK